MAKFKTDDIRPGDAVLVEVIVDSVTIRSDGTIELRTDDGNIINRYLGAEVEGTKAANRKTPPPIAERLPTDSPPNMPNMLPNPLPPGSK